MKINTIKPSIKRLTLNITLIFGILMLTFFVIKRLLAGTFDPTILLTAMIVSIIGLIIGSVVSTIKQSAR